MKKTEPEWGALFIVLVDLSTRILERYTTTFSLRNGSTGRLSSHDELRNRSRTAASWGLLELVSIEVEPASKPFAPLRYPAPRMRSPKLDDLLSILV